MRRPTLLATSALALLMPALANASETISYSYDARGRLISVSHAGSVNDGVVTSYTLDKADNRLGKNESVGAPASPSVSIGGASASEGANLLFTVTRSGPTTGSTSVDYASANGTAAAGSDYTAATGTLTFAAGETSKTITVPTSDDVVQEVSETMTVSLSTASGGATIGTAQGTGTIADNDLPASVSFSIDDEEASEGTAVTFTVTKSGSTTSTLSVNYATAHGTAGVNDYYAASGTLTFAPAENSKTVSVSTKADAPIEPTETFYVNLSNATSPATISDAQGVGSINDPDGPMGMPVSPEPAEGPVSEPTAPEMPEQTTEPSQAPAP